MATTSTILNNVFNSMQNMLQGGVLPRKKSKSALYNVKKNVYAVQKRPVRLSNMHRSPSDDLFLAMNRMNLNRVSESSTPKSPPCCAWTTTAPRANWPPKPARPFRASRNWPCGATTRPPCTPTTASPPSMALRSRT